MNPARRLSDRFRDARRSSPAFGLLLGLLVVPRGAGAQATTAAAPPDQPPPSAESPPAPPAASTTPPPAAAPAQREPAPASGEPAPIPAADEPSDHQQKKHKKHDRNLPAEAGAERPSVEEPARADKADLRDKANKHDLELKGRLFALAEVSHRHETVVGSSGSLVARNRDAMDLSLQSARFGVAYRSPLRFLSAQLELEVAGKPRVKDAFIEAGKTFLVKAGQFKLPSSALELESPWTLPLSRRGLVHDLMTDWLDIAGRRPGVAIGYKGHGSFKPRLTLGAFQGTTLKQIEPGNRDVKLIDHASLSAQTYAARAEITLAPVTLGGWYEQRVGSTAVGDFSHFATFGLDAEVAQRFRYGALRAWVDGSAGQSLYVNADKPGSDTTPWFASGRALVACRFGGLELGAPYVEPFGFVALFDPDTQVVADLVTEAAVGVAAGFWDRARLTLQGEMTNAKRNFPDGFLDRQTPKHLSLLLQAGVRF